MRREAAGDAFNRAEELIAALTESLKADGVAERDIQTRQFNLNPEFGRSTDNSPPPVVGWRAVHLVSVKLRDFAKIGTTIDRAVRALGPDATIQGINFAIEDTNALAAQARDAAIADARQKAEALASRIGVRVGRLVFIQETSAPPPSPVRAFDGAGIAAAVPAPSQAASISPGEQSLTVTVECVFEIE